MGARVLLGFHHTGIVVADLERMVQFYTEIIGLEVRHAFDSIAPPGGNHTGIPGSRRKLVFLAFPDAAEDDHHFELIQYVEPAAADIRIDKVQLGAMHICFAVDDIRQEYQRLLAAGVQFVTEPKFGKPPGAKTTLGVVYGQDPEGNLFELIQTGVTDP